MSFKKDIPHVIVVFDTNIIHQAEGTGLCNNATINLIKNESSRDDITTTWYIPDVVLKEREYQMKSHAVKLLNSVRKLENQFNYTLNVEMSDLEKQIAKCVKDQLNAHNIKVLLLDESKVNLQRIIYSSCHRHLPFSEGESEKGFRDAMIAESFFQFVPSAIKLSSSSRIVFLTSDVNLNKYIKDKYRDEDIKSIVVLSSIDELAGLINTLTSTTSEAEINEYQLICSKYFFDSRNNQCLYFTENIYARIAAEFSVQLSACPRIAGLIRNNSNSIIHEPQFIKKERSRVAWSTKLEV